MFCHFHPGIWPCISNLGWSFQWHPYHSLWISWILGRSHLPLCGWVDSHRSHLTAQGAASITTIARSRNLHHGSSGKNGWKLKFCQLSTLRFLQRKCLWEITIMFNIFNPWFLTIFHVFFWHENQVGPNLEKYHRIHVHLPTCLGLTKTRKKIQIHAIYQPYITVPPWARSHPPNINGFLFTWTMTVTCEKPIFV